MLMDFIQKINWVDIVSLAICIRAVFIGIKTGFVVEFFKSLGILFSIFITLHYFSDLTVFASTQITFLELPTIAILAFFLLWSLSTLIFKLIREGVQFAFSIQAHPVVDRWGGAILSALRGVIVCGMVFYALLLSYNPGIIKMARESLSKTAVSFIPTGIYTGIYYGFVVKFFPTERMSQEAVDVPLLMNDTRIK